VEQSDAIGRLGHFGVSLYSAGSSRQAIEAQ
jgi:hypothetical protein